MKLLHTDWYKYLPAFSPSTAQPEFKTEIPPELILGKSITRFHLIGSRADGFDAVEVHAAHYPEGDLSAPAQCYLIRQRPCEGAYNHLMKVLDIPNMDHKAFSSLLGGFKWVQYHHTLNKHTRGGCIYVDTAAMQHGWSTSYF